MAINAIFRIRMIKFENSKLRDQKEMVKFSCKLSRHNIKFNMHGFKTLSLIEYAKKINYYIVI